MKKTIKSILAVALSFVMLLGTIAVGGGGFADLLEAISVKASADSYSVGDIIEYGTYPQSEVTDEATIAALNSCSGTWVSCKYYSGDGYVENWISYNCDDGKMVASDYMRYKDVSYNGDKYRAVTFDSYRYCWTGLASTTSTSYNHQQTNGYICGNVYWFRYEPIKWRVLDPSTGLVMCDTIIDSQAYNNYILYESVSDPYYSYTYWGDSSKTHYANSYAESSIREWLNDDFYNTAFSATQKANILTTTIDNSAYSTEYSAYNSASTSDKVYLLSYSDVLNSSYGFATSTDADDTARMLKGSDYAKAQGLWVYSYSGSIYDGCSSWQLRSEVCYSCRTCGVLNGGCVSDDHTYTYDTGNGVVPALNLQNIKSAYAENSPDTDNGQNAAQEGNIIAGNPASSQKTYNYKSTVTFNVNVPEGGSAAWYLNDSYVGSGSSYTTPQMKNSYTVKVVVTAADGTQTIDTENVTIKSGFFDKVVAFFVLLFNKNAYTYVQK